MGIDANPVYEGGYMEGVDFGYIIGILGTVVAMYFALKSDSREAKQETSSLVEKESEHASAVIEVELRYIRENLDEIKANQKSSDSRYLSTVNELSDIRGELKCLTERVGRIERRSTFEGELCDES